MEFVGPKAKIVAGPFGHTTGVSSRAATLLNLDGVGFNGSMLVALA